MFFSRIKKIKVLMVLEPLNIMLQLNVFLLESDELYPRDVGFKMDQDKKKEIKLEKFR